MNDDLISRQAAIDALCSVCGIDCDKSEFVYSGKQEDQVILCPEHYALTQLPSAQPEQQWVLVKEKLPEEDKDVLVTVHFLGLEQKHKSGWNDHIKPSYYVDIASHIDGEWSSASDEYKVARNRHIVIAWKELPDPYRGEGENG